MKQKPKLLASKDEQTHYRINLTLQEGRTATFTYSDRTMARDHWDQLRFHGVIGGFAIRDSHWEEIAVKS